MGLAALREGRATTQAVDHIPSYSWDAATQETSTALPPYTSAVVGRKDAWRENLTTHKALGIIGIWDGVTWNPKVLRFQNRAVKCPHPVMIYAQAHRGSIRVLKLWPVRSTVGYPYTGSPPHPTHRSGGSAASPPKPWERQKTSGVHSNRHQEFVPWHLEHLCAEDRED